jgi:hypothetical protein
MAQKKEVETNTPDSEPENPQTPDTAGEETVTKPPQTPPSGG